MNWYFYHSCSWFGSTVCQTVKWSCINSKVSHDWLCTRFVYKPRNLGYHTFGDTRACQRNGMFYHGPQLHFEWEQSRLHHRAKELSLTAFSSYIPDLSCPKWLTLRFGCYVVSTDRLQYVLKLLIFCQFIVSLCFRLYSESLNSELLNYRLVIRKNGKGCMNLLKMLSNYLILQTS